MFKFRSLFLLGGGALGAKLYFQGGVNHHAPDMSNKTVLITGGNSGIGRETARELYRLKANVIITGRDEAKAAKLIKQLDKPSANQQPLKFYQVDFEDLSQIKEFTEKIKKDHGRIDILVNNAGHNGRYRLTKDGVESTMAVNHLAPVYLTSELVPLLKESSEARVVTVSSLAHRGQGLNISAGLEPDFDNYWTQTLNKKHQKYNWTQTYPQSKLANVLFTKGLQRFYDQKKKDGEWGDGRLKAVSLHPGVVMTDMFRPFRKKYEWFWIFETVCGPIWWLLWKDEFEGAQTTLYCCLAPFAKLTAGEYYANCAIGDSSPQANDVGNVQTCWEVTNSKLKELTGDSVFA